MTNNIKITPFPPLTLALVLLAGCAGPSPERMPEPTAGAPRTTAPERGDRPPGDAFAAATLAGYKTDLAQHIARTNADRVFAGRPQALLRSVVVVKYHVDANGRLLRSDILRSNHDRATESTALGALRKSAPFPKPAAHLLRQGRVEITETWLFNNDGRFQLRTIAAPQMAE